MYLNHNSMATNAANNLTSHYSDLAVSTKRLSSGLRINSAADDAAGLAVRELMRADIAAMTQGIRNCNDGISLIQVADSALGTIDSTLIRMKELSEQAATGTYDSIQRGLIDSEFQQMLSEIDRIADSAEFNGIKLLDGSNASLKIHFGPTNQSYDYYNLNLESCKADDLGLSGASIAAQSDASNMLAKIDSAIEKKDSIRANLGAQQNRLESTLSVLTAQTENLQAAESRISDANVATEMTNFVSNQILTQSAVAMLSQANTMPQLALQLIR